MKWALLAYAYATISSISYTVSVCAIAVATVAVGLAFVSGVMYLGGSDEAEQKRVKKVAKVAGLATAFFVSAAVFLPAKSTLNLMLGAYVAQAYNESNPETLRELADLPENLVRAANDGLESISAFAKTATSESE